MTPRARLVTVLAVIAAAQLTTACAWMHRGRPSRPGQAVVVLLPDDDGTTGRAGVANKKGDVDLRAPRDSTEIVANRKPAAVKTMSEEDVKRIFGDALTALPPAPRRYTLFFRFESDELTDESRGLFPEIIKIATMFKPGKTSTQQQTPGNGQGYFNSK